MSSNQDPARQIAERVARRLAGQTSAPPPADSSAIGATNSEQPRARVINFVSTTAPGRTPPSIGGQTERQTRNAEPSSNFVPQVAQSPWLAPFARATSQASAPPVDHPSQERFGVEEAAVSELVEFFENEKQCSVDPSGQPCDHCAMCSSRGF